MNLMIATVAAAGFATAGFAAPAGAQVRYDLSPALGWQAGWVLMDSGSYWPERFDHLQTLTPDGQQLTDLRPTVFSQAGGAAGLATVGSETRVVRWSGAGVPQLLPRAASPSAVGAVPTAMSRVGAVLANGGLNTEPRPVLWSQDGVTVLPPLAQPSGRYVAAFANDVNDLGQVAGGSTVYEEDGYMGSHAVLWDRGRPIDLGTFAPPAPGIRSYSDAYKVNNSGEVVGNVQFATEQHHGAGSYAFVWSGGAMVRLSEPGPDRSFSSIVDLNEAGQALFNADHYVEQGNDRTTAYIWRAGQLTALRGLKQGTGAFTYARDIADTGVVVASSDGRAAVALDGRTFVDLNNLVDPHELGDWRLVDADTVREDGRILVEALRGEPLTGTFQRAAFILTPVPEPGSAVLLLLGVGCLMFWRTGRKHLGLFSV